MKLYIVVALAAGSMGVVVKPEKQDAGRKELDKLQGTWVFVSVKFAGAASSPDQVKQSKYVIKGSSLSIIYGGRSLGPIPFQIDPAKKPKAIDILRPKVPNGVQPAVGIYALQGDSLTICFAQTGKPRPTAFISDGKTGN